MNWVTTSEIDVLKKSPSLTTNFLMLEEPNSTASAISIPACTAVTKVLLSTAVETAGAGAGAVTIDAACGAAAGVAAESEAEFAAGVE